MRLVGKVLILSMFILSIFSIGCSNQEFAGEVFRVVKTHSCTPYTDIYCEGKVLVTSTRQTTCKTSISREPCDEVCYADKCMTQAEFDELTGADLHCRGTNPFECPDGSCASDESGCPEEPETGCTKNTQCGSNEFCKKPDGDCDAEGICMAIPKVKLPGKVMSSTPTLERSIVSTDGICGCDGKNYASIEAAYSQGVSIMLATPCPEERKTCAEEYGEGFRCVEFLDGFIEDCEAEGNIAEYHCDDDDKKCSLEDLLIIGEAYSPPSPTEDAVRTDFDPTKTAQAEVVREDAIAIDTGCCARCREPSSACEEEFGEGYRCVDDFDAFNTSCTTMGGRMDVGSYHFECSDANNEVTGAIAYSSDDLAIERTEYDYKPTHYEKVDVELPDTGCAKCIFEKSDPIRRVTPLVEPIVAEVS